MIDASFNGPLFIIGMPRSGTKLLRGLLNQHPHVWIPPSETEFFPWLVSNCERFGNLSERDNFHRLYTEMEKIHYFQRMSELGRKVAEDEWYESCEKFTPAGIFEAMVRSAVSLPSGSCGIWGDKSPSYICHVALLKEHYPSARFIHIVRDVRDYCLSIHKAWGKNMLRAAQRWADYVDIADRSGSEFPGDVLIVRYEDLIENAERELRLICEFLGVEYNPSLCALGSSVENLGDAKDVDTIMQGNKLKYISGMKPAMRNHIESICWPLLDKYDYPHGYVGKIKHVNPLLMKILQFGDAVSLFRFHIRDRGLLRGIALVISLYSTSGNRQL